MEDWQLLRNYLNHGSEAAFRELMGRHLDLVYGVAARRLGDNQAAEDVSQAVFCLLARKASWLKPETSLVGWLHQTAFFLAAKQRQSEQRRQRREQEAAFMSLEREPEPADARWDRIAPVLDEAMSQLSDPDRQLLLQRYFKGTPFIEVGRSLGISEDAARMRANRALEKMRRWFQRHGVATTATGLASLLAENAMQAVPASTAQAIQNLVIQTIGMPASPSWLTALRMTMKSFNLKTALCGTTALLAVFVATLYVYNRLNTAAAPSQSASRASQFNPVNRAAANTLAPDSVPVRVPFITKTADRRPSGARLERESSIQVAITAKLLELSEETLKTAGLPNTGAERQVILSEDQVRDLVAAMKEKTGVDILSAPNVITLSGRQAQIAVTTQRPVTMTRNYREIRLPSDPGCDEVTTVYMPQSDPGEVCGTNITVGPAMDILPTVQPDDTIQSVLMLSIVEFLGYQPPPTNQDFSPANADVNVLPAGDNLPQPRLATMSFAHRVTLASRQTVLCGPYWFQRTNVLRERVGPDEGVPSDDGSDGDLPSGTEKVETKSVAGKSYRASDVAGTTRRETVKKARYLLATATIIDPSGNPLPAKP